MSTNTTDPYVPALNRHVFTAGGCSNGTHSQPCFNESSGAFDEMWDGYIYVSEPIDNCVLKVSADDNACFYLHAFPDNKANLPGRGPSGGGSYASAESTPISRLEKGYYRVHVSFTNINYSGANVARLDVLLNGTQITIGQLETHNKLNAATATNILNQYKDNVSYRKSALEIWALFGERAVETNGNEQTCATRVSIALSRAGYTLTGATYSDGSSASNNVVRMGWDPTILNADGSNTKCHIVMSAAAMSQFYDTLFGDVDYEDCSDYQNENDTFQPQEGDIVIFGDEVHVGICPGNDESVASFMCGGVRLLYRPSWGDPA